MASILAGAGGAKWSKKVGTMRGRDTIRKNHGIDDQSGLYKLWCQFEALTVKTLKVVFTYIAPYAQKAF